MKIKRNRVTIWWHQWEGTARIVEGLVFVGIICGAISLGVVCFAAFIWFLARLYIWIVTGNWGIIIGILVGFIFVVGVIARPISKERLDK